MYTLLLTFFLFPKVQKLISLNSAHVNLLAPELIFNFSTSCVQNVKNTETKYVRIMKQTTF